MCKPSCSFQIFKNFFSIWWVAGVAFLWRGFSILKKKLGNKQNVDQQGGGCGWVDFWGCQIYWRKWMQSVGLLRTCLEFLSRPNHAHTGAFTNFTAAVNLFSLCCSCSYHRISGQKTVLQPNFTILDCFWLGYISFICLQQFRHVSTSWGPIT